ncbi:MAG: methyltransferase type 12 [Burkholderiales bacterium]|nr:methyltransferase type 12 [Burkholderiales bacterium]
MSNEHRGAARAATTHAAAPRSHDRPPARPAAPGAWRERLDFLRGFLAHPQQVGSVIPSSRALEQRLVRRARLEDARCVVELGPGTGGTTRALLRALAPQAQLLAIELGSDFAARLRATIGDPRLIVETGSAEDIGAYLAAHRLPAPAAIVSGIPFSTMPPALADRIAAAVAAALAPGGRFVAYQVRAAVAGYATPHLGAPQAEWEWINIPPVRVFTWTRTA